MYYWGVQKVKNQQLDWSLRQTVVEAEANNQDNHIENGESMRGIKSQNKGSIQRMVQKTQLLLQAENTEETKHRITQFQ